jgi:RHS repeat-associated protein
VPAHPLIRTSASLLLATLLSGTAVLASGRTAEEGGGFQPGHTLLNGPGGDFISPFSGDVETVIDIGPALKAGGGLDLSLRLHHSSKIWTSADWLPDLGMKRRGAFGVGWKLHLGRLYQTCENGGCSGIPRWVYESPDGAQHEVGYPVNAAPDGQPALNYLGTSDGTFIRVEALSGSAPNWTVLPDDPNQWGGTPNAWRLFMGNGIVHTLARTLSDSGDTNHQLTSQDVAGDFRGWYTTKIERWKDVNDPVGQITVTYGSGGTSHCIQSIEFRALPVDPSDPNLLTEQRRITFVNQTTLTGGATVEGGYTSAIRFPALDGTTSSPASYQFFYSTSPYRLIFEPDPVAHPERSRYSGATPTEFLLNEIEYPNTAPGTQARGYLAAFTYDDTETAEPFPDSTRITGEMRTRKLPTGATIKYVFGTYSYVGNLDPLSISHLREVKEKHVYLGDPGVTAPDGTWLYERFRGGSLSHPQWSRIEDPFKNDTVYEFGDPGQAGKVKYFRGRASADYGRSTASAGVRLVRTTRTLHSGTIPQHEWTVLEDYQGKMIQTQRTDPRPFGHFGMFMEYDSQAQPGGTDLLSEDVVPYRKTATVYKTFSDMNNLRWKLWSITQVESQILTDGLGNPKRKTTYTYADDGRVLSKTSYLNPADPNANTAGNIRTEYRYDPITLNLERSFTFKIGESAYYGTRHQYAADGVYPLRSYVLNASDPNGAFSQAFGYDQGEVADRDVASGIVRTMLDASDVATQVEYDLLGRVTKIDPAGAELPTVTSFPSINETVTTRAGEGQTIQTRSLRDALGRVVEVRRRTESGTCEAKQTTLYDIAGRATFVSEWGFDPGSGCSTAGLDPATEVYSATRGTRFDYQRDAAYWGDSAAPDPNAVYDPLGRLLRVQTSDNHWSETRYAGLGTTVTIDSVGLVAGAAAVSTYYERDAFGNLVYVDAPEGSDATYTYRITGELDRVDLAGFNSNNPPQPVHQIRSFVYDGLGRLVSQTNPEEGTVSFTSYDAMGRVKEKVASDGTVFTYTYDPAGRVLTTLAAADPNTASHLLSSFAYDTTSPAGNGKLGQVDSYDETGAIVNRRTFVYGGLNGRMSEEAITFAGWDDLAGIGSFDKTFKTCFSAYNSLGQLTAMRYPADVACSTMPSSVANLEYSYANGALIGVNDTNRTRSWVNSVVYNPAGGIRKLVHGNGKATSIVPDTMGRPRAISVLHIPGGSDFDPNNQGDPDYITNSSLFRTGLYGYDGAGNITSIGPSTPGDSSTLDVFAYDKLSRLRTANVAGDPAGMTILGYIYDDFGNITSTTKSVNGQAQGTPIMSTSLANNRLIAFNGSTSFYDQRGNLLGDASTQSLFDERNRLLAAADSIKSGTGGVYVPVGAYVYDAGGERILKEKPGSGERTFYVRDSAGNVLTELTVPARKYDEYFQKDYFYAFGKVIGMAEEKAPTPVQGVWSSATYLAGNPEEEIPASGSATINWTLNPAVESITAYRVFRRDSPTGAWAQKGGDLSASTTSFTQNSSPGGVVPGNTYYYRVAAVNGLGLEGIPSRTLRVDVASLPTLNAPSSQPLQVRSRSITFRWQRSSNDTDPTAADGTPTSIIQGYNVYRMVGTEGNWIKRNLVALSETVFHDMDPNLNSSQTYSYQVRALSTRGTESAGSLSVSGSPADFDPPVPPTGVSALPGPRQDEITVVWNKSAEPDVTFYRVYEKIGGNYTLRAQLGSGTTAYAVGGIGDDANRTFAVSATDVTSESALSVDAVAQRRGTLAPPVLDENFPNHWIDLENKSGTYFKWSHPTNARVRLYRKLEEEPWQRLQAVWSNSGPYYLTEYTDKSFDWCRAYTYQLRAFDRSTGRESADPNPDTLTYTTERVISPTTPAIATNTAAQTITIAWNGIDHCPEAGNGFQILGWVVHTAPNEDSNALPLLSPGTLSYTRDVSASPTAKYGFAVRAKIRNLHRYSLNPNDPVATFWSAISLDVCSQLGQSGDLGEQPDCPDVSSDNNLYGGGGGGGGIPDRQPLLLRFVRPGPGASLRIPGTVDDTRLALALETATDVDSIVGSGVEDVPDVPLAGVLPNKVGPSPHRMVGSPSPKEFSYSFIHTDHLGSPRLITDVAGAHLAKQKHLPFGEELQLSGTSGNTHKFTGHERDVETGNDYMHARYFDSRSLRFGAVDPLPTGNLYSYVYGNPVTMKDPRGMAGSMSASRAAYGVSGPGGMRSGIISDGCGSCGHDVVPNGYESSKDASGDASGQTDTTGGGIPTDPAWNPIAADGAGGEESGLGTLIPDGDTLWAENVAETSCGKNCSRVSLTLTDVTPIEAGVPSPRTILLYVFKSKPAKDVYHQFPHSFDKHIYQNGMRALERAGYVEYVMPGAVNGAAGFYQLGGKFYGDIFIISHRFFQAFK